MVVAPSHLLHRLHLDHYPLLVSPPALLRLKAIFQNSDDGKLADESTRVYVLFPRLAQTGVTSSSLEIQSLTLSNPTPTSFHLEQDALLTNHNTYHPRLDAFNASLSVGGSDKPYAYIQLPAVHANETTTTHVDQEVQITDMNAFVDYNTQLLTKGSVDLVVKGRTKLHEMRFPVTTVDYRKTGTMKGKSPLLTSLGCSIPFSPWS